MKKLLPVVVLFCLGAPVDGFRGIWYYNQRIGGAQSQGPVPT